MPDYDDSLGGQTMGGEDNDDRFEKSLGDELTTNDAAENLAIDQTEFELVVLTDRYEIEGELGQGGMGKVLLARDKRLPRQVAIKSLLPELAKSSIGTERFLREARSAATLNHPNIVQIHDLGMTAQGPFFVMEYVQGGSLLDRLNKGPVEVGQAVDMICQLCNAVATAHDAGIIHRDIKPANIMLDLNGIPKLTDFGIARQDSSDDGLTKFGTALGTIDYMPPEQRRNAADADARSDIWSLAGTLYLMLTGDPPLVIESELIPPAYRTTLTKALKLRKEDRFQSALELREQLIQNTSNSEAEQTLPIGHVSTTSGNTPSVDEQVRDFMDSAKAHCSNGEHQKAIDHYTKAIELNPENAAAYTYRGDAYYELGEHQRAIEDYTKAIELNPENAYAYRGRGYVYDEVGDHWGVIDDCTKAIELEPHFASAHLLYYNRGNAKNSLGEYRKAVNDYSKAIKVNPGFAYAYFARGKTYNSLGKCRKAVKDFNKVIKLTPDDASAYFTRGKTYNSLGIYRKAVNDFNKVITLDPEYAGAYASRGDANRMLFEYQNSVDDYTKAIERTPEDVDAYRYRGGAYYMLGEYQKDIDDCTKAIELKPNCADAYTSRGNAYCMLGEYQKAIDDYTKAIALDSKHYWAYYHRCDVYETLGETELAEKDRKKYQELTASSN